MYRFHKIIYLLELTLKPKIFFDARNLLNRKQIDAADIPVLFVELETGQNGTLTLYPGQGFGQTWLGADGATITLEGGVEFKVTKFTEKCISNDFEIINSYYLDNKQIIRQSNQYHSKTLGYILIQRLDQ